MTSITIPIATSPDAEKLMTLAVEAFTRNYELYGHYPPGLESPDWHKEQIEGGHCHSIMLEGELVGGIYLLPHPDREMKIDFIFVGTAHQGKKIGSAVMRLIEERYPDVAKWFLHTPCKDFHNHRFYEKFGYSKVGEFRPMEDNEFTLFHYEKTP